MATRAEFVPRDAPARDHPFSRALQAGRRGSAAMVAQGEKLRKRVFVIYGVDRREKR